MDQWPLVVADSLLIATGLVGGVVTLVRVRRMARRAAVLAVTACAVLLCAAVLDLYAWLGGAVTVAAYLLICVSFALLIAAVHVGSRRPTPPAPPPPPPGPRWAPPRQARQGQQAPRPPQGPQADDWATTSGVWSIPRGTFDEPHS